MRDNLSHEISRKNKDKKDKARGLSSPRGLSGPIDLNALETGSSLTHTHSFTVNGLNYSGTENDAKKVHPTNVTTIPLLLILWYDSTIPNFSFLITHCFHSYDLLK